MGTPKTGFLATRPIYETDVLLGKAKRIKLKIFNQQTSFFLPNIGMLFLKSTIINTVGNVRYG